MGYWRRCKYWRHDSLLLCTQIWVCWSLTREWFCMFFWMLHLSYLVLWCFAELQQRHYCYQHMWRYWCTLNLLTKSYRHRLMKYLRGSVLSIACMGFVFYSHSVIPQNNTLSFFLMLFFWLASLLASRCESFIDAEVQQRAVEYIILSHKGPSMVDIMAEMPKFPERQVHVSCDLITIRADCPCIWYLLQELHDHTYAQDSFWWGMGLMGV